MQNETSEPSFSPNHVTIHQKEASTMIAWRILFCEVIINSPCSILWYCLNIEIACIYIKCFPATFLLLMLDLLPFEACYYRFISGQKWRQIKILKIKDPPWLSTNWSNLTPIQKYPIRIPYTKTKNISLSLFKLLVVVKFTLLSFLQISLSLTTIISSNSLILKLFLLKA